MDDNEGNEVENDSIRDSLSAAFDEDATEEASAAPADEEASAAPADEDASAAPADAESAESAESLNAPASWSPTAREEWAKVPKEVQETISKREKEISDTLQESAQARQQAGQFNEMIRPFQGMFAAQGVQNPMQGVYNILQTTAQLQNGTPQNKAQAAANLVKQFGVNIKDLDDALVGNVQDAQNQNADPRYDDLSRKYEALESRIQNQDQAAQHDINQETTKFLTETPFANDVRGVMADFMDQASTRGEKLTLKEAYDRAIATRPDIQTILANRQKTEDAKKHTQNARNAGVTVPINSDGDGVPAEPTNLRGALEQAWANG